MTEQAKGRHRADVEINVIESFELRSRRSIREAEKAKAGRQLRRSEKQIAKQNRVSAVLNPVSNSATAKSAQNFVVPVSKTSKNRSRSIFRGLIMMTASGLMATFALPSYAFDPDVAAMARLTTTSAEEIEAGVDTQNLTVAAVNLVKYDRGTYKSKDAAAVLRQETLNEYRSYNGPTAADYVKNPPYSRIDSATVLKVAAKYVGVPYVFGGSTPKGFDCSGYTMFVFAQFGIKLPHSVRSQSRLGIKIRPEDAVPGDLVIFNDLSHNGIYAGNGNFYHAPRPGDRVKLAPIFSSNVFFMRLGTD